jgi:hypothetical protein
MGNANSARILYFIYITWTLDKGSRKKARKTTIIYRFSRQLLAHQYWILFQR